MIKSYRPASDFAPVLIRVAVGCIFLSEGIQKFLFPGDLGVGRFEKIGIPAPEFLGPFVGAIEIISGVMILIGLFTRFFSIPLIIIMLVAISVTKIALIPKDGFWETAHGARTDFAMLLSNIYLLISGPGRWSLDYLLHKRKNSIDGSKENNSSRKT